MKVERRKMEEDEQVWVILYIYTWKCYNETPYVPMLNKNVIFLFTKLENRKVE
jgi:hypothetical protein